MPDEGPLHSMGPSTGPQRNFHHLENLCRIRGRRVVQHFRGRAALQETAQSLSNGPRQKSKQLIRASAPEVQPAWNRERTLPPGSVLSPEGAAYNSPGRKSGVRSPNNTQVPQGRKKIPRHFTAGEPAETW